MSPDLVDSGLRDLLRRGFDCLGQSLALERLEKLGRLTVLLASWADRINLTGHRGRDEIARRLVLDSAALLEVLPPFEALVDLGSGAGFPGIPIAILRPDSRVLLVESREKHHVFQRAALRELRLSNLEVRRGRFETLHPEPGDLAIAQAVGPPDRVLDSMIPWARPGGWIALPGGEQPPAPTKSAQVAFSETQVRRYLVPFGPRRTLWLGRRRADQPSELAGDR